VLGELPGRGFYVAARACGVARRAFEVAIKYAQQRRTFGKPIAEHQAIEFKLAEMGTKVVAAHQMMVMAARLKDRGEKSDLPAGMAKYLASEYSGSRGQAARPTVLGAAARGRSPYVPQPTRDLL
jgi:alkylation response protein AidB-like acyl-CoA dehydrogenase